jgi:hypothetical protein
MRMIKQCNDKPAGTSRLRRASTRDFNVPGWILTLAAPWFVMSSQTRHPVRSILAHHTAFRSRAQVAALGRMRAHEDVSF